MALIPPQNLLNLLLYQERLQAARRTQIILIAAAAIYDGRGRRARTVWVKPWLQRRVILGQYDTLVAELMRESCGDFKAYLRMQPQMFHEILAARCPSARCPMSVRSPTDVLPGAVRCLSELKSTLTAFSKKLPSGAPLICDYVSKMS